MPDTGKIQKVLLAKMGLDGHDNGITIVAKWLRDAGFEVVYAGLYNTPDRVVSAARQEDVGLVGLSFLGGEHFYYSEKLIQRFKEEDMGQVKLILGGVIPPEDVGPLKEMGIAEVFTPGAMRENIIDSFRALAG
jgi:methylmalonyl-CoA mutase C-terminal domain/subunit